MSRARLATALVVITGTTAPLAQAARTPALIEVGGFSSQTTPGVAGIGAVVGVSARPSSPGAASGSALAPPAAPPAAPPPPTLPASAPLLALTHPAGAGSLWYQGPPGQRCIYVPDASPLCYLIVAGASAAVGAPIDVPSTAAQLASQIELTPGTIEASPSAGDRGLTGAASWFWLSAPLGARTLTLSLDGETYTLHAQPSAVQWQFGDGAGLDAGAGVADAPGAPPTDAVTHVYTVRCLPGDAGAPGAPAGCGSSGYLVTATVDWTIDYRASGPVEQSGSLAARSTVSELRYPVSEVRAFLVGGQT